MKNKKFIGFLLALVMLFSAVIAGGTTAMADEAATVEAFDVDAQLNMIFYQLEGMAQKDSVNPWYYTVTDLDHDGNLEFIAASVHPQDRSTNLKVWEVNADRSSFTECSLVKDPDESFPDIMTDCADTFHDAETDTWYYLFYDNIVISNTEVYTIKSAVNLKNSSVGYDAFAVEHTVIGKDMFTVDYTDMDGQIISQAQYNASGVDAFAGLERSSTNFDWFTLKSVNSVARLADSYAVFVGMKAPSEAFPVPKPAALQALDPSAPSPTAAPVPTAAPAGNLTPAYLMITKNPTGENRKVGETAWFVSCANAFDSLTWTMVAPNGGEFSVPQFRSLFPKGGVSGEYSTTLTIGKVETDMNGWGAYCTFYYRGQSARTSTAYLTVKDAKPTPPSPTPYTDTGKYYGTVIDYSFSTVTVDCPGIDYFTIPLRICTVVGNLDIGADATVYWVQNGSKKPDVTACTIESRKPDPEPVYGSMSGTAYHDTAFTVYVVLQNNKGLHIDSRFVNIIGGNDIEGAPCVVYYTDYPSESTVYQVDIFGRDPAPQPEPEPQPDPGPIYGSMSGKAYEYSGSTLVIELENGDQVYLANYSTGNYKCHIYGQIGPVGGCPCIVYYVNSPTAENIYELEVYGFEQTTEPEQSFDTQPVETNAAPEEPAPVYEEPANEEPMPEESGEAEVSVG